MSNFMYLQRVKDVATNILERSRVLCLISGPQA